MILDYCRTNGLCLYDSLKPKSMAGFTIYRYEPPSTEVATMLCVTRPLRRASLSINDSVIFNGITHTFSAIAKIALSIFQDDFSRNSLFVDEQCYIRPKAIIFAIDQIGRY